MPEPIQAELAEHDPIQTRWEHAHQCQLQLLPIGQSKISQLPWNGMKSPLLKLIRSFLPAFCLCLSLHAQQAAPLTSVPTVSRSNAVPFAQGKAGPLLSDLYIPEGAGPYPAIVFIHGGDWIGQDRTQMTKIIEDLASHGYVGMAIDYDLSPSVHFPVALYESKEAIRWLRAHAATYHIDPQRIAVAGSSAGGELAALVGLTNGNPRFEGDGGSKGFSSSVKAAIIYNGVLDLTTVPDNNESIIRYLGSSCSAQKELCIEASPQRLIGPHSPPIYIGHGNADQDVPYAQFTAFVAAYKRMNRPITPFTADGGPHTYWAKAPWFRANADATLNFLKTYL
jgi:acetyl esterase/lipase